MGDYIFQKDPKNHEDGKKSEAYCDVARIEYGSHFYEPFNEFDSRADTIKEETELMNVFNEEHRTLKSRGKDGPLYYKTIEFYRDGHAEGLSTQDEITVLSKFLGVNRKRTSEIKCRARKLMFQGISKDYSLEETKKNMEKRCELENRFDEISIKDLLKIYDTRRSLFLNTYLDEMAPRLIRHWRIIRGNGQAKPHLPRR